MSTFTVSDMHIKAVRCASTLPFQDVIARLDEQVNKAGSHNVIQALRGVTNQDEFRAIVEHTVKHDFLYFHEVHHHRMLQLVGTGKPLSVVVYTIGNPLIAQKILRHNPLAAYDVPLRLLIVEEPDGAGTSVHYHLASSVLGLPDGMGARELQDVLASVDAKLERLVKRVTGDVAQATL